MESQDMVIAVDDFLRILQKAGLDQTQAKVALQRQLKAQAVKKAAPAPAAPAGQADDPDGERVQHGEAVSDADLMRAKPEVLQALDLVRGALGELRTAIAYLIEKTEWARSVPVPAEMPAQEYQGRFNAPLAHELYDVYLYLGENTRTIQDVTSSLEI